MGHVPFPPLPAVSGARPQFTTSAEADVVELVEGVGVEPTQPVRRLDYSQGISPMKAPPNLELTASLELTTSCLQDRCSAN